MKRNLASTVLLGVIAAALLAILAVEVLRYRESRATRAAGHFTAAEHAEQLRGAINQMFAESRTSRDLDPSSANGRDPWVEFERMQARIDRMFDTAFADFDHFPLSSIDSGWNALDLSPAVDMRSTPEEYVIRMSMPGLEMSTVRVDARDGLLTIRADTEKTETANGDDGQRTAVTSSSFERSIRLPPDALSGDVVDVQVAEGVLEIRVPRAPEKEPSSFVGPIQ